MSCANTECMFQGAKSGGNKREHQWLRNTIPTQRQPPLTRYSPIGLTNSLSASQRSARSWSRAGRRIRCRSTIIAAVILRGSCGHRHVGGSMANPQYLTQSSSGPGKWIAVNTMITPQQLTWGWVFASTSAGSTANEDYRIEGTVDNPFQFGSSVPSGPA